MARRRSRKRKRDRAKTAAAQRQRPELVAWRRQIGGLLESLLAFGRDHYGAAIDTHLAQMGIEADEDRELATQDFLCMPGSAADGRSVLRNFCEQAGLESEAQQQVLRWESQRRRGVFIVQAANRERLVVWDPLEGAPLTLHLLEKLGAAEAERIHPGAVVTTTFLPWMARLVGVVQPEFFTDPRALALFREQTTSSGVSWHEAPAAAPERLKSADA